jgi:hypothetical protein
MTANCHAFYRFSACPLLRDVASPPVDASPRATAQLTSRYNAYCRQAVQPSVVGARGDRGEYMAR